MFGLGDTKVVIRTDATGRREVVVKRGPLAPRNPEVLAPRVAAFVRGLPVARGTIRITRPTRRSKFPGPRLIFSRNFDERLAQRIRNYVQSLT